MVEQATQANKIVHVIGGGTISHVRNHLALAAPAYGGTARRIAELCKNHSDKMEVKLHLTRMADPQGALETPNDVANLVKEIVADNRTKIVFFNPAIVDFEGSIEGAESGKYGTRLKSYDAEEKPTSLSLRLTAAEKVINLIRSKHAAKPVRKDIFLVGFKATCGLSEQDQYLEGLNMLKRSSCNLVLANDTRTRVNMVITPEEASYSVTTDRDAALKTLVEMAYLRSHLTFTRSTVIAGEPVAWNSELVPQTLRSVVDYCIGRGAYKKFRGVTAGHFAAKLDDHTFLTSRRRTDFGDMANVGLVKVTTDGPDSVIAYGSKPSVGGQSQRIVFTEHADTDCIVHFHCPIKPESEVPRVSQREYECGSHECGANTSRGLKRFGDLYAVYLENHGPNIVFNKEIDPAAVVQFIEDNFDLSSKTGGYAVS